MNISIRQPFEGNYPVTFPFGARPTESSIQNKFKDWGLVGHHGIDYMVPSSTPILACDDGNVIQSGKNGDFGISVSIQHSWGESIYAHLKEVKVDQAQIIKKGDLLGLSGETGVVTGAHLHFGIKPKNSENDNGYFGFIDPAPFIKYAVEAPQLDEVTQFEIDKNQAKTAVNEIVKQFVDHQKDET